jgi:integrase/recombinase XerD
MSALRAAVDDYLTVRRALGYKLRMHGLLLREFVSYLEQAGAETVSTSLALEWAKLPSGTTATWWAARLSVARGFARHLRAIDPRTEVPPPDLLPRRPTHATPYLYSDAAVVNLMQAARTLRPPFRGFTLETVIGLLAVTGMRIGEALGLDREDVDLGNGLLTIRQSKFGKSRQIPIHASTVRALTIYAQQRNELLPRPADASFFISTAGKRLIYVSVQDTFHHLVRQVGLEARSRSCRPRLHDLRHTFAIQTLLSWYRDGGDVESRLPRLSTYLGHNGPETSYWYLSATPELLALAAERLERALGEST